MTSRQRCNYHLCAWLVAIAVSLGGRALAQNTDVIGSEPPPVPEAPYPGAAASDDVPATELPKLAPRKGRTPESHPEAHLEPLNERPKTVNEDGDYVYDTEKKAPPKYSGRAGITAPKASTADGEYLYEKRQPNPVPSGQPGIEPPVSTSSTGEYRYKTETHLSTKSASFHVGFITPPSITNSQNGITFAQIYGGNPTPMLWADYEFYHRNLELGRFGLKFGSGIYLASGQGQWATSRGPGAQLPYETFNFAMLPNTLTGLFKFQWADQQWVVPYVEGGPGYFTFAEVRSDAKLIRGGGSPTVVGAGGLNFLIDKLEPQAIRELDLEYGINHLWFSLELRGILGLETNTNFTSMSYNAGFMMEF